MPQKEKNGVKTLMGVKRFDGHFWAIFLTDHKVASKIANASHDNIYVTIFAKILSAGRREEVVRTWAGKICGSNPPLCRPPFFLVRAGGGGGGIKKFLQFC